MRTQNGKQISMSGMIMKLTLGHPCPAGSPASCAGTACPFHGLHFLLPSSALEVLGKAQTGSGPKNKLNQHKIQVVTKSYSNPEYWASRPTARHSNGQQ